MKLIGQSIDSIHAHVAWAQNIKEKLGVEIPFPIIADIDMSVAKRFAMIHGESKTAAIRAVDALQTVDKHSVACPANWKPGDKVIVPPPKTIDEVKERLTPGKYDDIIDFYPVKKSV